MSLHGLVVMVHAQNVRGVGFDPHWGLFTFQSYYLEVFKRVNADLFSLIELNLHVVWTHISWDRMAGSKLTWT